jgi:HK97 gp10 family phage protein
MTVTWAGEASLAKIKQAAFRGVVRATEAVRNNAVARIMDGPKTGRVYRRRGVEHQASAPGEAPASDTGNLANSADTQYEKANLLGRVNFSAEYGSDLEWGTENMEARPFARPALAEEKPNIEKFIRDEIAAVVK